jgi:hypothetical protein
MARTKRTEPELPVKLAAQDNVIRVPRALARNKAKVVPVSRDRLRDGGYRHVD